MQTTSAAPFSEDNVDNNGEILSSNQLNDFTTWVNSNTGTLGDYDHYMLFTG